MAKNSIFSPESALVSGLGKLTMILCTAMLWTITSLPIITVGASCTAVFTVMLKSQRGEDAHWFADYFRAFRDSFKQSTVAWLLILALGAMFGFCMYYYNTLEVTALSLLFGALLGFTLVIGMYVFPIISRFENRFSVIIMMAAVLPFQNWKRTIAMILLVVAVTALCLYVTPLLVFAYGLFAFGASFLFMKIFRPLEDAISEHQEA